VVFASQRDGGFGSTDIYVGEMSDGKIVNIRNLGSTVNTKSWESQPSISGDGRIIFFTSNRPGGFGNTDIWMTWRDDKGSWSAPANLGPSVNTTSDERSPYVTPDGGTLYFSSNGFSGYGGFDIFMSNLRGGAWMQPVNLGSEINSDGDELFFVAPRASDRFFVASNRAGGAGGLDIYSGTPNVFSEGAFQLTISVHDSTTGQPLPALVSIFDSTEGKTVAIVPTNSQGSDYTQMLPAGRSYRIVAQVSGYTNRLLEITNTVAGHDREAAFLFGPVPVAEFDLGRYNVPFFVTGYYRPNTHQSLDDLLSSVNGGTLGNATYIERFDRGSRRYQQYSAYAESVESVFRTVYREGVENIFRTFKQKHNANETLEIIVTGFADPQQFIGTYFEPRLCSFADSDGKLHSVRTGDRIGNLELSGLRAWYSGEYLDHLFAGAAAVGFPEYSELRNQGKITYRFIGAGVNENSGDYAAQRRIHIAIVRRVGGMIAEGSGSEFDSNREYK
jgi:hypothetical protein